ncbi:DUF6556 family protein [Streptococcus iniae]|uniref:DUF6556 family protein n=1 Tax=Streptococcus iniae TaxID=1346 RepID=UPI000EF7900C|nr:DUF6556 family protein [Streptococcus iniae]RLV06598.1 hypothetical protein DIX79_04730 [Streptococcus iniae]RLV44126.1 hypothetical protein DIX43_05415 [Streptococcus iniae]
MTSHYSRKNKRPSKSEIPTKHIKAGLTTLQKNIALVGSILSIIVATITITRALHPEREDKKESNTGQPTSTIVKIIEKESSSQQKNDSQTELPSNTGQSSSSLPSETPATQSSPTTSSTPEVPLNPEEAGTSSSSNQSH